MAAIDHDGLLAILETRWDWYSARAVRTELLAALGLEAHRELGDADLARIADWLEKSDRRAAGVVAALRSTSTTKVASAPPKPAAAAALSTPAPAPAPAPFEVRVTTDAPQKLKSTHAQPLRITSPRAGTMRWGINGWKAPPAAWRPPGTSSVEGSETVETKLAASQGAFVVELAAPPAGVKELDLNVRFDDGAWAKDVTVAIG